MKRTVAIAGAVAIALLAGAWFAFGSDYSFRQAGKRGDARLLFVGDMMFDRTIRSIAEKKGYDHVFSCVTDYLDDFDLVVGNLEGPITPAPSRSSGTGPGDPGNTTFTFDTAVARALADANVGAVSLGNNHIYDMGRDGIDSTVAELDAAGVRWFGVPGGRQSATTTAGDARVALVAFNQFVGENDPERAAKAVASLRGQADLVVAYAHWGDEYVGENDFQRRVARKLVDAGVDLVVGSHPHIVQGSEAYGGGQIHYSLGNFIFDQYWEEAVRTGGGLEATWKDGRLSVKPVSFDIRRDGTTCLIDADR